MLSDNERREMRDDAQSAQIREAFRKLHAASRNARPMTLDEFVAFLSMMSRFSAAAPQRRPFVRYSRVLL